jgi:hypothetical protein
LTGTDAAQTPLYLLTAIAIPTHLAQALPNSIAFASFRNAASTTTPLNDFCDFRNFQRSHPNQSALPATDFHSAAAKTRCPLTSIMLFILLPSKRKEKRKLVLEHLILSTNH